MGRLTALLLVLLFTWSCAGVPDYMALEDRVAALEKGKAKGAMLLAQEAGANKFWWRSTLAGLQAISAASLTDNDMAIVGTLSGTTATGYIYIYDASDTTATNSPINLLVSGGGNWWLCNFNAQLVTSNAADGTHYMEATNAGDLASGSRAEGRCWYDTTSHLFRCIGSDGSTPQTIGP